MVFPLKNLHFPRGFWRCPPIRRRNGAPQACRPAPEIKAQCYHMETRTRHTTNQDGTTRTVPWPKVAHLKIPKDELLRLPRSTIGYIYIYCVYIYMEVSWNRGYPQIIHLNGIFDYKPSISGTPHIITCIYIIYRDIDIYIYISLDFRLKSNI